METNKTPGPPQAFSEVKHPDDSSVRPVPPAATLPPHKDLPFIVPSINYFISGASFRTKIICYGEFSFPQEKAQFIVVGEGFLLLDTKGTQPGEPPNNKKRDAY